ncbi:hypothetical protein C8R43DRAFT_1138505 [Mycena crocata]|nr:hypothetical protein C8R43DRAFT_1138505 [Mycena crocata]
MTTCFAAETHSTANLCLVHEHLRVRIRIPPQTLCLIWTMTIFLFRSSIPPRADLFPQPPPTAKSCRFRSLVRGRIRIPPVTYAFSHREVMSFLFPCSRPNPHSTGYLCLIWTMTIFLFRSQLPPQSHVVSVPLFAAESAFHRLPMPYMDHDHFSFSQLDPAASRPFSAASSHREVMSFPFPCSRPNPLSLLFFAAESASYREIVSFQCSFSRPSSRAPKFFSQLDPTAKPSHPDPPAKLCHLARSYREIVSFQCSFSRPSSRAPKFFSQLDPTAKRTRIPLRNCAI